MQKGKKRAAETQEVYSDAESSTIPAHPDLPVPKLPSTPYNAQELVNTLAETFRAQNIHPGSAFAALSNLYSSDPTADAKDPDALLGARVDTACDAKLVSQMRGFLDVPGQNQVEGTAPVEPTKS